MFKNCKAQSGQNGFFWTKNKFLAQCVGYYYLTFSEESLGTRRSRGCKNYIANTSPVTFHYLHSGFLAYANWAFRKVPFGKIRVPSALETEWHWLSLVGREENWIFRQGKNFHSPLFLKTVSWRVWIEMQFFLLRIHYHISNKRYSLRSCKNLIAKVFMKFIQFSKIVACSARKRN